MKTEIHPSVRGSKGDLLVREHLHHPFDQIRTARGAVQRLPPLLHRQAEAGGHRWPGGALRAAVRQAGQEVVDGAGPLAAGRAAKLPRLGGGAMGDFGGITGFGGFGVFGGAGRGRRGGWPAGVGPDRRWVAGSVGPALAWGRRAGVESLDVLVSDTWWLRVVSRRAGEFDLAVSVWEVVGTSLVPAAPAGPFGSFGPLVAGGVGVGCGRVLLDHGCEVVHEHGELRGEVLGLEVARVVDGEVMVGVGRHDREARASMRPGVDVGRVTG